MESSVDSPKIKPQKLAHFPSTKSTLQQTTLATQPTTAKPQKPTRKNVNSPKPSHFTTLEKSANKSASI
jgi:hypothetical protein